MSNLSKTLAVVILAVSFAFSAQAGDRQQCSQTMNGLKDQFKTFYAGISKTNPSCKNFVDNLDQHRNSSEMMLLGMLGQSCTTDAGKLGEILWNYKSACDSACKGVPSAKTVCVDRDISEEAVAKISFESQDKAVWSSESVQNAVYYSEESSQASEIGI